MTDEKFPADSVPFGEADTVPGYTYLTPADPADLAELPYPELERRRDALAGAGRPPPAPPGPRRSGGTALPRTGAAARCTGGRDRGHHDRGRHLRRAAARPHRRPQRHQGRAPAQTRGQRGQGHTT